MCGLEALGPIASQADVVFWGARSSPISTASVVDPAQRLDEAHTIPTCMGDFQGFHFPCVRAASLGGYAFSETSSSQPDVSASMFVLPPRQNLRQFVFKFGPSFLERTMKNIVSYV
jgi:hypothetical protein